MELKHEDEGGAGGNHELLIVPYGIETSSTSILSSFFSLLFPSPTANVKFLPPTVNRVRIPDLTALQGSKGSKVHCSDPLPYKGA